MIYYISPPNIPVVLNALRHQRLWHRLMLVVRTATNSAQRLAASEVMALGEFAVQGERQLCSTPCGIRGYGIGQTLVCLADAVSVLNALRHQRLWH